jgi:hypothetical protein
MKTHYDFRRARSILSGLWTAVLFSAHSHTYSHSMEEVQIPAPIVGVHHLGPDFVVYKFWINKAIGDNISEEGGGGSMVCCVTLPLKWRAGLVADVRWEVDRILKTSDPKTPEIAKVEGIYRATVPVEKYAEPGNFFVHFFPNGRVRIIVSATTFDSETHPVRREDPNASKTATIGMSAKSLFTDNELAELLRRAENATKEHGGWR